MCKSRSSRVLLASLSGALVALAGLAGSYELPLEHDAIQYASRPVADPIAKLQQTLSNGDLTLDFDDTFGYLPAVLKALNVPRESQVLVFSKTSFQAPRIFPRSPRAIYFNDQVSVGWVRNGDMLEVASVDPKQGVIFYTLDQEKLSKPRFERRDTCLQCHISGATLGVPGLMVRSVYPDKLGMPLFAAGSFVTDHRSPFKERWGGWYVSGTHGSQVHMGNALARDREKAGILDPEGTQNITDLSAHLDTAAYLMPHSDIVALMALEHQTHMTNLITRVGFETRLAVHDSAAINKALGRPEGELTESATRRINNAVEELLQYMLFTQETRLTAPVRGVSGFSKAFVRSGPRDRQGRSLRDLDLKTRLLRYPCSYLIYSEAFDELPEITRERLYRRLWEVLTGRDTTAHFASLSTEDRKATFEILRDTKKGLPDYWTNGD
jgi:hypothetical protein